jgi:peptidoglycan/xylan/chitin deacetylase (PgdA/CDA1 family)
MEHSHLKARAVAVLGYHKVGEPSAEGWKTWYYVPEAEFVEHLTLLRDSGHQVVDLTTFLCGLEDPAAFPPRPVLLTFDDGYRSIHDVALPWLQNFGFPAVVFVPADHVGKGSHSFDADGPEPDEPLCTWDELRTLQSRGVTVQCHGAAHLPFSSLTVAEQCADLLRSRRILERELRQTVSAFAYPYGDAGSDRETTAALLRGCGYATAFVYDGRRNTVPLKDPFAVSRLTIGAGSDLRALLT